MWKKLTAFILTLGTCAALAVPVSSIWAKAAETEKYADVYILAGQSNAVGHGLLTQKVKNQTDESYTYGKMIAEADSRNTGGYPNVLYYGASDVRLENSLPDPNIVPVKVGLGGSAEKIGPELGMANVLSQTATQDHPAVIIKYAAGGTTIGDYKGTFSEIGLTSWFGNWASPTILNRWEEMGRKDTKFNGVMYNRLLEFLDNGLQKLVAQGYTPVIKAYVWMQGESDSDLKLIADEYFDNLRDMINDLREAVAEMTGDSADANKPFVMGKISSQYNYVPKKTVKTVRDTQDAVAQLLPYCYTVETEDFPLYDIKTRQYVGTDNCHFNAGDQYELGKRFATVALENIAPYSFSVTSSEGGTAGARNCHSQGTSVTVPFTAEKGYKLSGVLLNGDAVDYYVEDAAIVLDIDGAEPYNDLYLEFEPNSPIEQVASFIGDVAEAVAETPAGRGVIAAAEAFMAAVLFAFVGQ